MGGHCTLRLLQEYSPTPPPAGTHDKHMATDHQAEVPGEGAHKVYQGWAEVGGSCEHQALGAEEGKEKGHEPSNGGLDANTGTPQFPSPPGSPFLDKGTTVWPPAGPCTLWASSFHL